MTRAAWTKATKNLPTKSAKIRALNALGVPRAEIARFLDIRYQHVRNVLTAEKPAVRHVAEAAEPYAAQDNRPQVMQDGSVRIPRELAAALGAGPGEALVGFPQDGGLWIATPKASRANAQALVRKIIPAGANLVDELIAWRRQEAEDFWREHSDSPPKS